MLRIFLRSYSWQFLCLIVAGAITIAFAFAEIFIGAAVAAFVMAMICFGVFLNHRHDQDLIDREKANAFGLVGAFILIAVVLIASFGAF